MENLKEKSVTEILKMIHDCKKNHERIKQKIVDLTIEMEEECEKLYKIEEDYLQLVKETNERY